MNINMAYPAFNGFLKAIPLTCYNQNWYNPGKR